MRKWQIKLSFLSAIILYLYDMGIHISAKELAIYIISAILFIPDYKMKAKR